MIRIHPRFTVACLAALLNLAHMVTADAQTIVLADQPIAAGGTVPGNLALSLSVEFPTANSIANIGDYADLLGNDSKEFLGYFDPRKCYDYVYVPAGATPATGYFQPKSKATGPYLHRCSGYWSGNFMNWAATQTIDPFRWALTGGYRSVDQPSLTIIEKAWASTQSGTGNYPNRGTSQGSSQVNGNYLPPSLVSSVTPFSGRPFNMAVAGLGNTMTFSVNVLGYGSIVNYKTPSDVNFFPGPTNQFSVFVRVKVCDPTFMGIAGLEANCVAYGANYKPEGLLQQYSGKIRFAAFSYLNGSGQARQGGVIREPMGYIGPTYIPPTSSNAVTNTRAEWSGTTGIMNTNPDPTLSGTAGVPGTQSGVMNYLNKFGETSHSYMTYDNVSELYYASVRYFEHLGNVPEWTNSPSTTELDGFPEATTWDDPILYACQRNFILGIGDDHTWTDYNTGGATDTYGSRPKPPLVASDKFNKSTLWTQQLQALEGIAQSPWWPAGPLQATYYIAGLAYGVHVNDIRPDLTNSIRTQTISTYWMDVAEDQEVEYLNPYYLATKYGGFAATLPAAPATYDMTTALTQDQWDTSGLPNIFMNGGYAPPPDNYFVAANAGAMVQGLRTAFLNAGNAITGYTTSFSLSQPTVALAGTTSFASQYDSNKWTSTITATTLAFDSNGNPITPAPVLWASSTTLQNQLAGNGWKTARNIATWNGSQGVPFEAANLSSTQLTALLPGYSPATTNTNTGPYFSQYLNYLRGDRSNEVNSTTSGSTHSLRTRTLLLGDIVDASLTPVAVPNQTFSESTNPGYGTFKNTYVSRAAMVYAAANDGMLHGFVGSSGVEQFAYVPSATIFGPNNTPQIDGLVQLGNPAFSHHYYVDATPLAFDVDLNHTYGSTGSSDWRTVLIGGLGKGGKSYYAIDISDPVNQMTNEAGAASKVLWEFSDPDMGYSFGTPMVIKTAKYGWVVALTSGYNNSNSGGTGTCTNGTGASGGSSTGSTYGYLFLVNPRTGACLEKIVTTGISSGMTQGAAYVQDYTDYTADAIYVGDLNGQLWRFSLKGTAAAYPAPTLVATLKDAGGNAQPLTTAPLIEIHPATRKRYVMLGTGRLLSSLDASSTAGQTFYTLIDGTAGAFSTITTPITRSDPNMLHVTDVNAGITLTPTMKGWYFDLGTDSTSGLAWRVVLNPKAYNGIVAFADTLPTGDACSPRGLSRVYAVNYSNGTSVLGANTSTTTTSGSAVYDAVGGFIALGSSATDLSFTNINGRPELIAGDTLGDIVQVFANLTIPPITRLLNWREIPTVD